MQALGIVAAQDPKPHHRAGQPQRRNASVGRSQVPTEDGADIVMFHLQAVEPDCLLCTPQPPLALLCHRQIEIGVPLSGRLCLALRLQLLQCILSQRL
jgi:hypothetical protein